MRLRALTWNLYHGRDFPPDATLFTKRSRLLRVTERNETHLQVNRNLYPEFAATLAAADWDVALLQECPPRWRDPLARDCRAEAHRSLTARNSFGPLRALAARINPDLTASNEGGSNLTLVRPALGGIAERRELVIRDADPERRTMAFTRTGAGPCIANLHASAGRANTARAEEELRRAAATALEWAAGAPLLLGGDLNLRPRHTPIYGEIAERFALAAPTASDSLDHLLVHGLNVIERPAAWPPERRERAEGGRAIRLSDHAPVEGLFEV
jgi:endonuclease/exonuclease/phosphatase family metal-dependent hydrolase